MKSRHLCLALVLVLCAISANSFAANAKQQSATRSRMLVSTKWLASSLHTPSVVILQIARDRTSYDQGHIPGARLILLNQIAVQRDGIDNELPPPEQLKEVFESAGVSNASRVVLYDDAQGLLAARAYFTLDYLGIAGNAALLNGGLSKWRTDGHAVDTDLPKVTWGKLTLRIRPELVVPFAGIQEASANAGKQGVRPAAVLIDARPAQQFASAPSGSGHIPGARNVFWMDTLESSNNPVLKSATLVRTAYKKAGVTPGTKTIVYCNSGMQASHAYFTLKWLGYDPALYDGSFHDWIKHPGASVE